METDVETGFNVENPLHIDNIPVANLVVIEVEGYPILYPKSTRICDIIDNILDGIKICGAILVFLGMLSGMILFLILMCNPFVFGGSLDD